MADLDDRRQGGHKRRREEDEGHGRELSVVASLIRLCNKQQGDEEQVPAEEQLDNLVKAIVRDLPSQQEQLTRLLLDCAVELSHKTPVYAVLIGLVNTEAPDFVAQLLAAAHAELQAALRAADRPKARLLLRLLASLVPCHVLPASAVVRALQALVDAALEVARSSGSGTDERRVWQPYADYLVYAALLALPWGGPELAAGAAADLDRLLESVAAYMPLRPAAHTPALRPFLEGDDAASLSDSGAASFLGQVWEAVQALAASGGWRVAAVPSYVDARNEPQLAAGRLHELAPLAVPPGPPCLRADRPLPAIEAAAAVLAAYPPRGLIRLLPPDAAGGERPAIERLVADEYVLDTIHFFDGDRVECARTLALGLPLSGKLEPLLAEAVFSQMLRVPTPHLKPIAYATILADLCRLLPAVPRAMSACVREAFQRVGALDPQLRAALAAWLAYHLSNFDFMWPWAKWAHVLQEPPHHPQRRFVLEVFARLLRLSYHSNIRSKVPDSYAEIFPPEPAPRPLQPPAEGAPGAGGSATGPAAAELQRAAELVQLVRGKKSAGEVQAWVEAQGLDAQLGGPSGVLRALVRGLLVAGSKSLTHMLLALERYEAALQPLLAASGEQGQVAAVAAAVDCWADAPQRAAQAVDTLMAQRLVGGAAIARWAFASRGLLGLGDPLANSLAWEVLHAAVDKTLARTQDAEEEWEAAGGAAAEGADAQPAGDGTADEGGVMLGIVDDRAAAKAQALGERRAELEEARGTQRALFLLCFELFCEVLAGEPPAAGDEDALDSEAAAAREWRRLTVAWLRAFTRRYHAAVAPLGGELERGAFAGAGVAADVREAFRESLHI